MTSVYPIVLTPTNTGYIVSVPDLNIDTQGRNMAEAISMARDAIGLWGICEQDDGREIPVPSTVEPPREATELVSWVDIDFAKYRRIHDMATMRINVSVPRYLKHAGEEAGVNFSQILQEALKARLGLAE